MFIIPPKPPMDVASLRDNVFTFAAADFAPWLLQLNQINTALFLRQQRLYDMSFNQMALKGGWSQPGLKEQPPQHGLPMSGTGFYPETTTGEGQSSWGHRTSRSSTSPYVSPYSSGANVLASPEPLDSLYWHTVPPGAAAQPPFAHSGGPVWETTPGLSPSTVDYGDTLGVHTSMLPQTVFRSGEALHNLPLAPMIEKDSSTSSKLYASSEMLEAMALADEPGHSSWTSSGTHSGYGSRCVEISESDVTNGSWADPETGDTKTVSPNMLRIRQTPSPASSCESLHTSFLGDTQPLAVVGPVPSQAAKTPGSKKKKARPQGLPDRGQRSLVSSPMARRPSSVLSDPPSPPRRLTRLRPKLNRASPSPSHAPFPSAGSSKGKERVIELPDRMSKDDFLVRQKQMGMTYKEIRRLGGFTEAESTLRGRYRTLTKRREARVRKPEWSEKDLHLLENAVRTLTLAPDNLTNTSKVPWKRVAEYIVEHGGSYHFGNSTCRKRWDELVREMAAAGKGVNSREWFFDHEEDEFVGGDEGSGEKGYGWGVGLRD